MRNKLVNTTGRLQMQESSIPDSMRSWRIMMALMQQSDKLVKMVNLAKMMAWKMPQLRWERLEKTFITWLLTLKRCSLLVQPLEVLPGKKTLLPRSRSNHLADAVHKVVKRRKWRRLLDLMMHSTSESRFDDIQIISINNTKLNMMNILMNFVKIHLI